MTVGLSALGVVASITILYVIPPGPTGSNEALTAERRPDQLRIEFG